MTPEELRAIMAYLRQRVSLASQAEDGPIVVRFLAPTEEEMIGAGLNTEGAKRILRVAWWDEMVEDIVEPPEMCEADDTPEQVLQYARDVVTEYIRKRASL